MSLYDSAIWLRDMIDSELLQFKGRENSNHRYKLELLDFKSALNPIISRLKIQATLRQTNATPLIQKYAFGRTEISKTLQEQKVKGRKFKANQNLVNA